MRKTIKSILMLLMLVLGMCLLGSGEVKAASPVKITNISKKAKVYVGKSKQIKVDIAPEYQNRKLKWTSSNSKVGLISQEGVFKAKTEGKTTVKVCITGTKLSASVEVIVRKFIKTKAVKLEDVEKTLAEGLTAKLKATVFPANATYREVQWFSSRPEVASISAKGKIKALKSGKTRITVTVKNTKIKTSFVLKVKKAVRLKSLRINAASKEMFIGGRMNLSVRYKPSNTTFKKIQWSSDNKALATVSSEGVVSAKAAGKVKITARASGTKKKAAITITISKKSVHATGIQFTEGNVKKMEFGSKTSFHAQVYPVNADNKKIIWSTSDSTKATVDQNGVVTALRPTEYVDIIACTADKKFKAVWNLQITANSHGYLTRESLDRLCLSSVKKLMIVAHPDDETLWGGSHLLDDEYLVVCLTNGWNKTRNNDFQNVMNHTNEKRIILSYPDSKRDYWVAPGKWGYDTDTLSTCMYGIRKDLELILGYKNWETVVTHNPDGEYRKYHHKMTSFLVTETFNKLLGGRSKLYYFGHYYDSLDEIQGEPISDSNLAIKNMLIQFYLPTAQGAIKAFGHMIPYENWIPAEQWIS